MSALTPSKTCTRCNATKPLTDFYNRKGTPDGLEYRCKACAKEQVKRYSKGSTAVLLRGERIAKYMRTTKGRQAVARYLRSDKSRESRKRYRVRNRAKVNARARVYSAVRSGSLPPLTTLRCAQCGEQATQYHHPSGYDGADALKVVPLCFPCHRALDA